MGLFRRSEPIHKRLGRSLLEDEPSEPGPEPQEEQAPPREPVLHGVPRPRRFDLIRTAEAPGLAGSEVTFTALPDGTLLVEGEREEEGLGALADAVERELAPPYRARAVRQTETLWALSASRIEVAEIAAEGERLELSRTEEGKTLLVDGSREFGSIPELEQLGEAAGPNYSVEAERLDADLWEVRVAAL
ncbi:MAG TPA: hypothetical protein VF002_02120 [Gaiellaceae bacterium]